MPAVRRRGRCDGRQRHLLNGSSTRGIAARSCRLSEPSSQRSSAPGITGPTCRPSYLSYPTHLSYPTYPTYLTYLTYPTYLNFPLVPAAPAPDTNRA